MRIVCGWRVRKSQGFPYRRGQGFEIFRGRIPEVHEATNSGTDEVAEESTGLTQRLGLRRFKLTEGGVRGEVHPRRRVYFGAYGAASQGQRPDSALFSSGGHRLAHFP